MKRRHFILLLGGGSSGALGVGTGAFSSVDAERDVEVNVVEDEMAYLGLTRLDAADSVTMDEKTDVVRIQNQFASPLDLSIVIKKTDGVTDVVIDSEAVEIVEECDDKKQHGTSDEKFKKCEDNEDVLCPGNSAAINVKCDKLGTASFTLRFCGYAGGASVDKTRTFEVECVDPIDEVQFPGKSGNIKIRTESGQSNRSVSVTVYYKNADEQIQKTDADVHLNTRLNSDHFGLGNGSSEPEIIGVRLEGLSRVYNRANVGPGNTVTHRTSKPEDWP